MRKPTASTAKAETGKKGLLANKWFRVTASGPCMWSAELLVQADTAAKAKKYADLNLQMDHGLIELSEVITDSIKAVEEP